MRIVLCLLLASVAPLSMRAVDATPFTLESQGGIVVPVMINGTGPHAFLVDTGASHSAISEDLAGAVGAVPVARTTVSTPAGDRECIVVQIGQLAFGPNVATVAATALPAASLRLAGDVAGVLGQDVLASLRYTIDYRRRHILWAGPVTPDAGQSTVLPLAFHDGLPMVELQHGATTLRLVADSGSGGLVLFELPGVPFTGMTPGDPVRVDSFHGTTSARSVRIDRFRVGTSTFRDLPAVLLVRTVAPAHKADGLLPLHLFDRVTFDGPAGRLILG